MLDNITYMYNKESIILKIKKSFKRERGREPSFNVSWKIKQNVDAESLFVWVLLSFFFFPLHFYQVIV